MIDIFEYIKTLMAPPAERAPSPGNLRAAAVLERTRSREVAAYTGRNAPNTRQHVRRVSRRVAKGDGDFDAPSLGIADATPTQREALTHHKELAARRGLRRDKAKRRPDPAVVDAVAGKRRMWRP